MYTLELYDGTRIENLRYIHPNTLELASNDSSIYWLLSEYNLSFAFLYDEDDDNMLADVFIDYTLQNFSCMGGMVQFRIMPLAVKEQAEKHRREKELQKKGQKGGCKK